MATAFPSSGANCALLGNLTVTVSGSNFTATLQYQLCARYTVGGVTHTQGVPWLMAGTGTVSITDPVTTTMADAQTALIAAIKATEGLTTGDFIVYPDGAVVTL